MTSGLVVAARLGPLAQEILGLITTTSPLEIKREIPPAASKTFSVNSLTAYPSVRPRPSMMNFLRSPLARTGLRPPRGHPEEAVIAATPEILRSFFRLSLRVIR